jgi:signal transduction histidine kinase
LATVAPLVAPALHSALLVQRLAAQVQALAERERELAALNDRLVQVQEEERRRLALDLHDDALQRAVLLTRQLKSSAEAGRVEAHWSEAVNEITLSLRAICTGLRPPMLDDFGLGSALEWLVNSLRARSELNIFLEIAPAGAAFERMEPDLALALYRVAQEALNNILKHAGATHAWVILEQAGGSIRLEVTDNGVGLKPGDPGQGPSISLGLLGMRERLAPWGGQVSVESAPGGGTTVSATIETEQALAA